MSGAYAFAGGLLSFAGWVFNLQRLTDWINNGISIQPNTTLAVTAAGAALIALSFEYRRVAAALGVFVACIGGSVLFQYLTGINLGIDSLLMFDRTWGRFGVMAPGRMGPPGATSWTLIGITLVLTSLSGTPQAPGRTFSTRSFIPALGLVTASLSTLSIIGYLYGASVLYTIPTVTVIALQTATFILAVSLGLVSTVPERGPMRLISEDSPAGILTRRIVPAIITLPILVGFLRLAGERSGFYDSAFGSALRTVSEIGLFLILMGWTGNAISRQAKRREEADYALRISRRRLETELSDSRLLQRISAELIHQDDIQGFYAKIIEAAATIMRSDFASMQLLESNSEELTLLAFRGFSERAAKFWERVKLGSTTACGLALKNAERIIITDVEKWHFVADTEDLLMYRQIGIRAIQTTPLVSRSGKILGMISTHWSEPHQPTERDLRLFDILARQAADLLERRTLELQREDLLKSEHESRTAAEQANKLKDEFLATLSHELRNPLNVVLGYSELLLRTPEIAASPHLLRTSEALKRNAQSQSQLINDLLDLSRLQTGKVSLNRESVLLATIVDNAVETVRADANAKHIEISVNPPDEPLIVDADPLRMQQVVWNLLNNAVKFSSEGGEIRILLRTENDEVVLTIEDTGIGIDAAFLPHVFDMFRQEDSSSVRRHGGMGIGLALVQQLIQLHGGRVSVDSDGPGRGAAFTIRLPAQPIKHVPTVAGFPSQKLELSDLGVLVIDDSKDTTEMLRLLLEINGASVRTASSGMEALAAVSQHHFDVIISDVSMPGMDGFEFLRQLRERPEQQDVPVLALTGFGRPEDIERAKTAGFFSHITKPFDVDELAATLRTVSNKRRVKRLLDTA